MVHLLKLAKINICTLLRFPSFLLNVILPASHWGLIHSTRMSPWAPCGCDSLSDLPCVVTLTVLGFLVRYCVDGSAADTSLRVIVFWLSGWGYEFGGANPRGNVLFPSHLSRVWTLNMTYHHDIHLSNTTRMGSVRFPHCKVSPLSLLSVLYSLNRSD